MRHLLYSLSISFLLLACTCACTSSKNTKEENLNTLAEKYVKLVLRIGQYDGDFVDAYYGPSHWKPAPLATDDKNFPATQFMDECEALLQELNELDAEGFSRMEKARFSMMEKQLIAVKTKASMMGGTQLSFDSEAQALYDAQPPHKEAAYFDELLSRLDKALPGTGKVSERYEAYARNFIIPKDRLDTVFQTAITEARKRTAQYITLPSNENFQLEYVTDKSWSGYNYFKGNSYSLIQINTDFPIFIERAIDLACHEGYPGHHVFNTLLEQNLVVEKGWKEFSVYPLFSPQSLIAEGSANYGIQVAFPGEERLRFEKEVLFPLAGIDPSLADQYYEVQALREALDYAGNEAARKYLNGDISRETAAKWLEKYLLYEPERALQRTRFFDQYRSYVINYNLGKDLVANYVEQQGGTADNPGRRWEIYKELLSNPHTASDLQ